MQIFYDKYYVKNIQTCDQEERRRLRDLRAEREARSLAIEKAYVHDVYEQVIRTMAFLLTYRNVHDIHENVTNMLGISMPGILRECTYIFSYIIVLMLETKSTSLWNV